MAALQAVTCRIAAFPSSAGVEGSAQLRTSVCLSPSLTSTSTSASLISNRWQRLVTPNVRSGALRTRQSVKIAAVGQSSPETKPDVKDLNEALKQAGITLAEGPESLPAPYAPSKIWGSDVVATRKRPYFLNREWTPKDLQYAAYMAVVHGLCLFAPATFSWNAVGVFAAMYIITGMLGITLSFHRHLSHKSFVLPKWLEYVFAYCGVLAVQGPPMEWVSAHRFHHRYCDTEDDPHTPYEGFWHSHMGWLLDETNTNDRVAVRSNIADMESDPFYNFIEETYPWHVVGSAAALYALGGFPYLVWGLAVRVVWVYHITWAVNSAAHVWGYQSWNTGDLSRNNWWVAALAFGEGWHNNHHAFEYSSRHGLEWWQFDPTWYTVKLLESVGLASRLRYPRPDHMARLAFPEGEGPSSQQ